MLPYLSGNCQRSEEEHIIIIVSIDIAWSFPMV